MKIYDVIVIGGGQSGLALGYFLNRSNLDYVILDAEQSPGGAWQHYWKSLKLFSPALWSSLPGTVMHGGAEHYPTQEEVVTYFGDYETKYNLNVKRPVVVSEVQYDGQKFTIQTSAGAYFSKTLVGATGSFRNPWTPDFSNLSAFEGIIMHSSQYKNPDIFEGKKVAIVGEGNSGAQILAELSLHCETFWITSKTPEFLPDYVDGRYLFNAATELYHAKKRGRSYIPPSLGDIVMVPAVVDARERGVLRHLSPIHHFIKNQIILQDRTEIDVDAVIFCTGFRSNLDFLRKLPVTVKHDKIHTSNTHSKELPALWMVGYGSWTGFASATIMGVGRSAKATVLEIEDFLNS